jgi:FKBP-type peptidyl-prolyl cis-trans isomerase FklB
MKNILIVAALILGLTAGIASAEDNKVELKDQKDKNSYALGANIADSLKRQGLELNADILAAAVKDILAGQPTAMTEQEIEDTLVALQKEMLSKMQAQFAQAAEKNKKDGETFLAENKKKEAVVTTASGLQYKIIKQGNGAIPRAADTVTANYRGTLIDGTEFDSSYKRGEPAQFPVGGVIKGWQEALQLMPLGSKWQLFVPAELAYGERGAGGVIGPNAVLIFEVELVSIGEAKK